MEIFQDFLDFFLQRKQRQLKSQTRKVSSGHTFDKDKTPVKFENSTRKILEESLYSVQKW